MFVSFEPILRSLAVATCRCRRLDKQRDQNLEVDAVLGAAEDLLGFKPKAHVQKQVPVGTDEVRQQQLIFDLIHGVGQEELPATAGGCEQLGRKPGDVEKGI